ncbi:rhomboid family intramembrane serine protease [Persicirhabdus sediminis]|uniref:Peptidase S54 rhomboid domain-containing protein n=1 Tax=Persicirhabdus sediminis TaxID=454144 RepID=A0A8J7MGP3_9BACT|nr:rhomboid family intramembrane serine protease [Persicirhabdus sediminis]MBK1792473.1 hypothetical protein [Persicirhabdus sediminis]
MDAFLNRLENRFGRLATPGLVRYLALFFLGVYLLGAFQPDLEKALQFDLVKIMQGEVWRVITFIFAAKASSGFSPMGLLFMVFATMLLFTYGDALEQEWGVFRCNLYVFWGYISALLASLGFQLLTGYPPPGAALLLGFSIFFAFATIHPKFTILLFFILPVQIWILAAILGGLVLMQSLTHPLIFAFNALCLSNFFFAVVPRAIMGAKNRQYSASRRRKYMKSSVSTDDAFHRCSVCGATEISHPDHHFRSKDGKEYCQDHLDKVE